MTTVTVAVEELRGPVRAGEARAARRHAYITLALSGWVTAGLVLDAWSHTHLPQLEAFFTPWHALLYSGFLAMAGWISRPVWWAHRVRQPLTALPAGHNVAIAGAMLFGVGGVADMIWHTLYGLETGMMTFISPPHLMLFLGLILLVTTPFRAAWLSLNEVTPTFGDLLPALLSLAMGMAIVAVWSGPLWGFTSTDFYAAPSLERLMAELGSTPLARGVAESLLQQRAIVSVIGTNLAVLVPVLLLYHRWRPPFGSIATLYTAMGTLIGIVTGLWYLPVLLVSGLVADIFINRLSPTPWRLRELRVLGACLPLVLWTLYFLLLHDQRQLGWPPMLYIGVILLSGVCGLGLSVVIAPLTSSFPFPDRVELAQNLRRDLGSERELPIGRTATSGGEQ